MVANPDEPTKRGRGRPSKPLREDPERYVIACFIARMNLFAPRPRPVELARTLMQIHHAEINDPEEFAAVLAQGRKVRLPMPPKGGNRYETTWYNKDAANAFAANFLIKVRALEKKLRDVTPSNKEGATSDQRDAAWLGLMINVWQLAGGVYFASGDVRAAAKDLAAKAGESEYFHRLIAPLFELRGELPSGLSLPLDLRLIGRG